jgi:pimeloyl-ACP methyl ester carboxylesterase
LRRSEADLLEAQRLSHSGSWRHDLASGTFSVSPEVLRIRGVESADPLSHIERMYAGIHPDDRSRVRTAYEAAQKQKSEFDIGDIDVTELLPRVEAPTLVFHTRGDARVPFEHGLTLAHGIPKARLVALESKNHLILAHEPAWPRFINEMCEFLKSVDEPRQLTAAV